MTTVKQTMYELSLESHQKLKSIVFSLDIATEQANQNEKHNRNLISEAIRKAINSTFN